MEAEPKTFSEELFKDKAISESSKKLYIKNYITFSPLQIQTLIPIIPYMVCAPTEA